MKNVLIISSSPRENGNTVSLCRQFQSGACDKGNHVEFTELSKKTINYCDSCYECQNNGGICHIQDDMQEILISFQRADIIVFGTPVYFYSVPGQLKTFFDRFLAQWKNIENKEFYYIITAAQNHKQTYACTLACLRGFAVCLTKSRERGVLFAGGVSPQYPVDNTEYMQQAYDMGASV